MKTKVKNIDAGFNMVIRNLFLLSIIFALCFFIFAVNISAQTTRPETPIVVSRDNQLPPLEDEPIETVNSEDNIKIAKTDSEKIADTTAIDASKLQKKMLLYLDILTRVEQRAASLEKRLFDMIEKQSELNMKIKRLEYQMRPEAIRAATALSGSLRPEDVREERKNMLEFEKQNAETLLTELNSRRSALEISVRNADELVERIRVRFDKLINETLVEDFELL